MVSRLKRTLLVWGIGFLICGGITAFLVQAAFRIRGYWAIGGEYAFIPLTIVVCIWITDSLKKRQVRDDKIALRPIAKREP